MQIYILIDMKVLIADMTVSYFWYIILGNIQYKMFLSYNVVNKNIATDTI